ncbi:MAG: TetR/AcrR family transcriptional regulator, partial [Bdellovibrionota bacterium]
MKMDLTPQRTITSQRTNKGQAGLDEILSKSSRLMAVKGFSGTSMRDLAVATDRSLAGLYHYLKTKEELLYQINYEGFSSLSRTALEIIGSARSPDEKLHYFIANHIGYFATHLDEMKVMMFGTQELDSKHGTQIRALKADYASSGRRIVGTYLRSQSRKVGDRLSPSAIARKTYLLFGMMNWIFGWYSPKKHGSDKALAQEIFDTFTLGVNP